MTATLEAPAALCAGVPATATDGLQVPVPNGWIDYANFDHAASTPALRSVMAAVERVVSGYGSVHRGNGHPSRMTSRGYDAAREEVGRFVGVRDDDHVVFTRNTTDAWNLLSHALPQDTTVVAVLRFKCNVLEDVRLEHEFVGIVLCKRNERARAANDAVRRCDHCGSESQFAQ